MRCLGLRLHLLHLLIAVYFIVHVSFIQEVQGLAAGRLHRGDRLATRQPGVAPVVAQMDEFFTVKGQSLQSHTIVVLANQ